MSEPAIPEIPYPFAPWREPPRRTEPAIVPMVDLPSADPAQRLFERRTIMLSGPLDHAAVTRLSAQLMALDGRSGEAVELIVNSIGGPASEVTAALDVMEVMRARVNATCTGTAEGSAAVLVACAPGERRAGRHARLSLRLADEDMGAVPAAEMSRRAAELGARREHLVRIVAAATGRPEDLVAHELEAGGVHDATEAMALGIVDRVVEPR